MYFIKQGLKVIKNLYQIIKMYKIGYNCTLEIFHDYILCLEKMNIFSKNDFSYTDYLKYETN